MWTPLVAGGGVGLGGYRRCFKNLENINIAIGTALHKNILKIDEIKSFLKHKGYLTRIYKKSE